MQYITHLYIGGKVYSRKTCNYHEYGEIKDIALVKKVFHIFDGPRIGLIIYMYLIWLIKALSTKTLSKFHSHLLILQQFMNIPLLQIMKHSIFHMHANYVVLNYYRHSELL